MKFIHLSCFLGAALLLFTACEKRPETVVEKRIEISTKVEPTSATKTFETAELDRAIDAYRAKPTPETKALADKAFAELDAEIAELEAKASKYTGDEKIEASRKLADLQAYRDRQRANYVGEKAEATAESAGDALKDAAKDAGRAIEKAGEAIKEAVD